MQADQVDRLTAMGLVTEHNGDDAPREHLADNVVQGEAITVATNDEATALNERIRAGKVEAARSTTP